MEWRTIPGASGYMVSENGHVRSVDRIVHTSNGQKRRYSGKDIDGFSKNQYGHLKVPIVYDVGGKKVRYVHALVLEAFVGPRPCGEESRHLDGTASNNALRNLKYGAPKTNSSDKRSHGTMRFGETHPNAALTEAQVLEIKDLLGQVRQKDIAGMYGVKRTTISAISTGRSWGHLK